MAEYKVVFRSDDTTTGSDALTWEEGCPLQFEAIQISRNTENGQAFLQGKLRNISDQVVQSFKASITVEYEDGNTETVEFNPLDADIIGGAVYKLDPVSLEQGNAAKALGKVDSVKLIDGKWESSVSPINIPTPQPIGLSEEAASERYEEIWHQLKSVIPFHERKTFAANRLEEHDGWWLCPCGQVNVGEGDCAKCGVSLRVLQNPDVEDEESLLESAKQRAENEAKKHAEMQAAKKKRTRLLIKAGIALITMIVAVILLLVFVVFPGVKQNEYEQALSDLDSGNYSAAAKAFEALGDYEDAQEQRWQAEFMLSVEPFLNGAKDAYYFPIENPYSRTIGKELQFALFEDGSCTVHIPKGSGRYGDWNGSFSSYQGDWKGSWDPDSRQVTLPGFPGGENWTIKGVEKTTSTSTSTSKKYLSIESDDSRHSFSIYAS